MCCEEKYEEASAEQLHPVGGAGGLAVAKEAIPEASRLVGEYELMSPDSSHAIAAQHDIAYGIGGND